MTITSYRDLHVWQKSMILVKEIYKTTKNFPKDELFGLSSQMKRAAVSIPSNISEGCRRRSKKDYRHFLIIAFGSGAELETQIEIALGQDFFGSPEAQELLRQLEEVMRMLNALIEKLS